MTAAKTKFQWNIMMVGNHGRVIPLRRFLPAAIAAGVLVVLGLAFLVVLLFLFVRQTGQVGALQSRLENLQIQAEKLKDERDVYLAKMVILQQELDKIQPARSAAGAAQDSDERDTDEDVDTAKSVSDSPARSEAGKKASETPVALKSPAVKWSATVQDVSVTYDPEQKQLLARFKINNTSAPKNPLAGRCVVVLKHKDDPPIKWVALPGVLLTDGRPSGDTGYAFRINNFRTISLTAVNQTAPIEFDTASIYVFNTDGTLLQQHDHRFSIDYVPPSPKPQAPKPPATETRKSPAPPVEKSVVPATPSQESGPSLAPAEAPTGSTPEKTPATGVSSGASKPSSPQPEPGGLAVPKPPAAGSAVESTPSKGAGQPDGPDGSGESHPSESPSPTVEGDPS